MSLYKFLVTGYRPSLSIFSFEPTTAKIKLVSESSPAPQKATWVELADPSSVPSQGTERYLYSLSEANKGSVVSLKLLDNHIEITGQRVSHGGGVHSMLQKDLLYDKPADKKRASSSCHERRLWYSRVQL